MRQIILLWSTMLIAMPVTATWLSIHKDFAAIQMEQQSVKELLQQELLQQELLQQELLQQELLQHKLSLQEQEALSQTPEIGTRRGSKIPHLAGHFIKSFIINPIRHPVRTSRVLITLGFRNAASSLRDLSLHLLQFPRLKMKSVSSGSVDPMDLVAFEQRLDRITGTRQQHGRLDFLIDGDEYFPRFVESIVNARESVKIRTYIFDNDDYALSIAQLLRERSRSIQVKVMMDGLGTINASWVDSGTQPTEYVAPRSINAFLNNSDGEIKSRMLDNTWLMSDHIKVTIVDGQTAFLGGMNIGREYRYDWHDMMFEVSGPIVQQLENDFNNTWQPGIFGDLKGVREIDRSASMLPQMRLLYTRLHNVQIFKAQLAAIRAARQYIYVENAYFSDDSIRYELIKASLRGVDVRVILPDRGNHGPMNKSNVMAANSLLKYGVQVYTYPGMTHVKAMIADGWACFGSANMDKLSLKINKEMNIATSDQGIVNALKEKLFEQDFRDSEILTSPLETNWNYPLYELLADAVM